MSQEQAQLLRRLFDAAIKSALPAYCLPPFVPAPPRGRTLVLGAGKAAATMAQALEQHWQGELGGLVVTRYGHAVPCECIEVIEAGHPLPDEPGLAAARRMLWMTHALARDDLVICLFSGGGSALLPLPLPGLTLQDKQGITAALLRSGGVPFAEGQVDGFSQALAQFPHQRQGFQPYIDPDLGLLRQANEVAPQDIKTGIVARNPSVGDGRREDAKCGGGVKAGFGRQYLERGLAAVGHERIHEVAEAIDYLDGGAMGFRIFWHGIAVGLFAKMLSDTRCF